MFVLLEMELNVKPNNPCVNINQLTKVGLKIELKAEEVCFIFLSKADTCVWYSDREY